MLVSNRTSLLGIVAGGNDTVREVVEGIRAAGWSHGQLAQMVVYGCCRCCVEAPGLYTLYKSSSPSQEHSRSVSYVKVVWYGMRSKST
jgi:hypothetical protein